MNIAINITQLQSGRVEGVVTYIEKLLTHLPKYSKNDNIYLIKRYDLDIGTTSKSINTINIQSPGVGQKMINKVMAIGNIHVATLALARLNQLIEKNNINIIHYPFSVIPPSDFGLKIPIVLSVMDIQHEFLPEIFSRSELLKRRSMFGPSIKRADHIVSISHFTAESIIEQYGVDTNKISVVHLAGDITKTPIFPQDLPNEYMYYPAGDWSHKNHIKLFRAIKELKKTGFTGKLVMTGLRTARKELLDKAIQELGLKNDIIDYGQVSYDTVGGIYKKAKIVIFPSLFEGFGLPPLEAMVCGVPIACSNTTSLPEIVGNAAEMFDPEDLQSISKAIDKVWTDSSYRKKLIARGNEQSKKFSWDKTAQQTLAIYRSMYNEKAR